MSAPTGPGSARHPQLTVGLDITAAIVGRTGVAHYTEMLWKQLLDRQDVDVRAFGAGRGRTPIRPAKTLRLPLRVLHRLWRVARVPKAEDLVGPVDIVHSIDLVPPPTRAPLAMTIHDAFCETHPDLAPPRANRLQRQQLTAARHAAVVITTCEATADVLNSVGIARERIVVAPLGPRHAEAPTSPSGTAEPYLLAVGTVTPRKGFDTLAAAAALLGDDCPRIVIAGPDGWRADEIRRRVGDTDRLHRVQFLGERNDEDLASLYANALLVVHPSVAEGFGVACLEAMNFGRAVVATDIPATREIVEGCARLVPVNDPDTLATAIRELLVDASLRDELGRCGRERAHGYSWERMADLVVGAYEKAVASF